MATLPTHTVAVRLHRHLPKQMPEWTEEVLKNHLIVEKVPIPPLKQGQLLVKNERAPINPVDLLIISRQYSKHFADFPLPMVPGYEGDGTVIAEGGGFEWLVGKRVAARGHMWTEYSVIEGTAAVPLPDAVNWEEGSSVLINPLTVIGMIKIALDRGVKTIVHTAAASALGKMLIKYGKTKGVEVIGVVRKEQQVMECKEAGVKHVFNLNDSNFDEQLKNIALKENATLAFDAIGGEITGRILAALPHGSEVQVYGNLSLEKASGISWGDLVFERKTLSGYWLTELMKDPAFVAYAYQQIPQLMKGEFATKVAKTFLLEDIHKAIIYYLGHMTEGKCLLNLSTTRHSS